MKKTVGIILVFLMILSVFTSCKSERAEQSLPEVSAEYSKAQEISVAEVSEEMSDTEASEEVSTPETSEELPETIVGIPTVENPDYTDVYCYRFLNREQREAYAIYMSLAEKFIALESGEEIEIPFEKEFSSEDWSAMQLVVAQEHQEIYDLLERAVLYDYYNTVTNQTEASVTYEKSTTKIILRRGEVFEEHYERYTAVMNECEKILASLEHDGTEYGKVKAIAYWLADNVKYSSGYDCYNSYGALVNRSVVCEGYARAFTFMCRRAGITSLFVTGMSKDNGENIWHAWNKVRVDGEWYNVDTTWMVIPGTRNQHFMMPDELFIGNVFLRFNEELMDFYYNYQPFGTVLPPKATSTKYAEGCFVADSAEEAVKHFESIVIDKSASYKGYIKQGAEWDKFVAMDGKTVTDASGKKYVLQIHENSDYLTVTFLMSITW